MKKNHKGTILYNQEISKETYKLVISSDIEKACAGQFISILCNNKTLRRPFSISSFKNGQITVLYKLKGEGTNYIKSLKTKDEIDFLAPLGNTFNYKNKKSALLIGAGIGIAPMLFLKEELENEKIKNYLISGFKSEDEIILGSDKTVVGGSVLDDIEKTIEDLKPDVIYSCGPSIVLKLVSNIGIKHNIETQIAMEKVMACGIGVCRGCVIKTKENGVVRNSTVCKDGPVFIGGNVVWE